MYVTNWIKQKIRVCRWNYLIIIIFLFLILYEFSFSSFLSLVNDTKFFLINNFPHN